MDSWIELKNPVDRSRLIYGCPVCFLTTLRDDNDTATTTTTTTATTATTTNFPKHNVMVISWLIPADPDSGRILLSMNKRRHTASVLRTNVSKQFGLSIPTTTTASTTTRSSSTSSSDAITRTINYHNMEEMLPQVGSISGGWGRSKFPCDHDQTSDAHQDAVLNNKNKTNNSDDEQSKNKQAHQKRKRKNKFPLGIPSLQRTGVGGKFKHTTEDDDDDDNSEGCFFFIEGTVAHLECQILTMEDTCSIDNDHHFIVAEITRAFVRESFWDATRRVFGNNSYPYFAFFGSRQFGHTRMIPSETTLLSAGFVDTAQTPPWTRLAEPKQFSRLLYTNPLCFMTLDTDSSDIRGGQMPLVVAHLTATNNFGRFMFGMKQSLALKLLVSTTTTTSTSTSANEEPADKGKPIQFHLSVPVHGLEDLIRQCMTYDDEQAKTSTVTNISPRTLATCRDFITTRRTAVVGDVKDTTAMQVPRGCVAHMECQVCEIKVERRPTTATTTTTTSATTSQQQHAVVFAEVIGACVHPYYWNAKQYLFQPQQVRSTAAAAAVVASKDAVTIPPPYLKYLGDGVIGSVLPSRD